MNTKERSGGRGTRLFVLCFLAYTFSYFGRYNYSACLNSMIGDGLLDTSFGGIISSTYLVFYGAGQFINGRIGVRISPKIMVATGLLGSGCANLLMGLLADKYLFLIIWAANGYFNSMLWSAIIRAFTDWMNEKERVSAGANISLTIPVGMTLSYLISSLMLKISEWRSVFLVCGALLIIGGTVWILGIGALKTHIEEMARTNSALKVAVPDSKPGKSPGLSLKIFFASGLFAIAIIALFNGSLKDAVITWIQQYLIDTYQFTDSAASLVATLLPLFSVAGPYVAIFLDKKLFRNEALTSGVLFGVSAASLGTIILLGKSAPLAAVVLLAISMCCMWGVNTMILTFVPYRYGSLGISSAVTGTLNCTAYIASSSFASVYGSLANGGNWSATVLLWTVCAAGGTVACVLLSFVWRKLRPASEE